MLSAVAGEPWEKAIAFATAFRHLQNRLRAFLALPLGSIDRLTLGARLRDIGAMEGSTLPRGKAG